MKLAQFNLRAFGQFKDCLLNFDPNKQLHFIYGENESGKTTFTRAYLALLFGIEKKTIDDYFIPREHLYLEGLFESSLGKKHHVIREHRLSRKLNIQLQAHFPYINKAQYAQNFILNDESLQSGSKELLIYLKHFDINFFQNAVGLPQIKSLIKKMTTRSEELFKNRGSKPLINDNFQTYQSLLVKQEDCLLTFKNYKDVSGSLIILESRKKEILKLLGGLQSKEEQLELFNKLCQSASSYNDTFRKINQIEAELNKTNYNIKSSQEANWREIKLTFHKFLKNQLVLTTQQGEHEQRIEFLKKEIDGILSLLSTMTIQKNIIEVQNKLFELKSDRLLEENQDLLIKKQDLLKKTIEQRLEFLNLSFIDFKECLKMQLPSRAEIEQLSQIEFQIEKEEALAKSKEERLFSQKKDLDAKLKKIQLNMNFNQTAYLSVKDKRESLGREIQEMGKSLPTHVLYQKFLEYKNYTQKESHFINFLLKETDVFALYKKLENQIEDLTIELEANKKNFAKVELLKLKKEQTLIFYRRSWKLKSLNFFELKEVCAEVPKLNILIESWLTGLQVVEKNSIKLSLIKELLKGWLGSKYSDQKSLRDLFYLVEQNIEEELKTLKIHTDFSNKLLILQEELKLQLSKQKGREEDLRALLEQWQKFQSRHSFSLKLDEIAIQQVINETEEYLYKKGQLVQLKEQELKKYRLEIEKLCRASKNFLALANEKEIASLVSLLTHLDQSVKLENFDLILSRAHQSTAQILEKLQKNMLNLREELSEVDQQLGKIKFQKISIHNNSPKKEIELQIQNLLFELESHVSDYLTVNLTLFLLKKLIKNYQKEYQEPLVKRTGEIFSSLTSNRYPQIFLNILDEESFLTCRSLKGDVLINQLSQGCRDQLYLSLKLALIEQFIEGQEPMPIILDDILVQFDEKRTLKALEELHLLSKKSQVIFLTHHQHVIQLVKKYLSPSAYQVHYFESTQDPIHASHLL